ncbi:hypothetical protein CD934_24170 [Streptomyces calvus]|uniref:Uncharacterized protein n=2 Tax=Streptomyces calvus TaxID=67282 RepID=A0A514JVR9_9ACTN|nr:hypothetical protein CD934_24170 [Streptomyces calvus]
MGGHSHDHDMPLQEFRRHTGAITLIVIGARPAPKSVDSILEIANAAHFHEEESFVTRSDNGSIEYVPCSLSEHPILQLISEGRLQYKIIVSGSPYGDLPYLAPGTYYNWIEFVEGPDHDEGRWVARIVSEEGAVASVVTGVEVKQIFAFHLDDATLAEHKKPSVHVHGIGIGEVSDNFPTARWASSTSGWAPLGNGCCRVVSCQPER